MNKLLLCLASLLLFFACKNASEKAPETDSPQIVTEEPVVAAPPVHQITAPADSLSLDSLWNRLVFIKGGCLSGGQNFGSAGERCVMDGSTRRPNQWPLLFSFPKSQLTQFLLAQLTDTTTTEIHTCPCYPAIGSEVAVYALQRVLKKNWFALEGFETYGDRTTKGCSETHQWWLQAILKDEAQRTQFIKAWGNALDRAKF